MKIGAEIIFDRAIERCLDKCFNKLDERNSVASPTGPDQDTFERYSRKLIKHYKSLYIKTKDRKYLGYCRNKLYWLLNHWFINDYPSEFVNNNQDI